MRGRNPHGEHDLKVDLIKRLLSEGAIKPECIAVETALDWFPTRERDLGGRLIGDLTANPGCPLEHVSAAENEIWLTDADEAREFVSDLRDNPAWFEA